MAATLIDREEALSRVGGDAELLKEIANLFLDDYPKLMAALSEAVARGDAQSVERTAHNLKGSVSNFGANNTVEAAFAIESMGRARDLGGVARELQSLERALAALRPELESL